MKTVIKALPFRDIIHKSPIGHGVMNRNEAVFCLKAILDNLDNDDLLKEIDESVEIGQTPFHSFVNLIGFLEKKYHGLMVFAKNQEIKRILQGNWKKVEKRYYAVVEGTPSKKEGRIESCLSETKSLKVYSDHHSGRGKHAQTHFRVITQNRLYALLDILLETGRKHQIRVHLADIGHPVVGDKKYGARTDPFSRLGLHAYLLSFAR